MPLERVTKFMAAGIEDAELVKLEGQGWGVKAVSSHQLSPSTRCHHISRGDLRASLHSQNVPYRRVCDRNSQRVSINSSLGTDVSCPFGGKKGSGIGKEAGQYGVKEYLKAKAMKIKLMGFK
jgi:hypothetical protein